MHNDNWICAVGFGRAWLSTREVGLVYYWVYIYILAIFLPILTGVVGYSIEEGLAFNDANRKIEPIGLAFLIEKALPIGL